MTALLKEFDWRYTLNEKNKGVKSALVKPENVRIAFELPSKDLPI
jgi:hypothetical protein